MKKRTLIQSWPLALAVAALFCSPGARADQEVSVPCTMRMNLEAVVDETDCSNSPGPQTVSISLISNGTGPPLEVKRLKEEIEVAQVNVDTQRKNLLALKDAVKAKEKEISYRDDTLTLEQAEVRLAKDFETFRKLETGLATKKKMLEAEEKNLAASREQLEKLVTQKREFEIRVAQLEAEEAALQVQRIKSPMKTDNGRVADIEKTIKELEQSQEVERNLRVLEQQYGTKIDSAPPQQAPKTPLDLQKIEDHLQGKKSKETKVTQNTK